MHCASSGLHGKERPGPGPFFKFHGGRPLCRARDQVGLVGSRDSTQATASGVGQPQHGAKEGIGDATIKTLDRWKSSMSRPLETNWQPFPGAY